jgi:ribosomal protein S18 acetylase RimI-like enzyme
MHDIIIQSLKFISPQAVDFVEEHGYHPIWSGTVSGEPGCVIEANLDNMGLIYAALPNSAPQQARELLSQSLQQFILTKDFEEKCFNCRGEDMQSRALALSMGFKLEMVGYQLCRSKAAELMSVPYLVQPYTESELEAWIFLLGEAYRQLCVDNSWDADIETRNREQFGLSMLRRSARHEVYSCYHQGELVGGFRLSGAFIEDMAVLPEYQNRGIGSYLLNCATGMLQQRGYPMVQLRVAESNQAAMRLYLRNHFTRCGYFAEHGLTS